MGFYQTCLELIKGDPLKVFIEFHDIGTLQKGARATFIALIPKFNCASLLYDYRLISLIRSSYKIIAKVLF